MGHWRVTRAKSRGNYMIEKEYPFKPFTLGSGEERLVWIRGNFSRCSPDYQAPGSQGTDDVTTGSIAITYEALGRTRHKEMDLGFGYGVTLGGDYNRACA